MSTRHRCIRSSGILLLLAASGAAALGQSAPQSPKIAFKTELVLTPAFCATKTKKGSFVSGKETFEIGKAACAELVPALQGTFSNLTRVSAESSSGADVVLIPKLVDTSATKTLGAFSNREMVVLIEWTAKDASGKTFWVETVQGSAKHHMGNAFTYKKNLKLIVNDSVKDLAEQSAQKMAASAEFQKVSR
jgi:hypothetical protein